MLTLQVMGTTLKPVYRRRPRVDPSKLAVDQLTGDENVTVVNRNTGKRITGTKAPALRNLHEWLIRNPGFDIDAKWAHIVLKAVSICLVYYTNLVPVICEVYISNFLYIVNAAILISPVLVLFLLPKKS